MQDISNKMTKERQAEAEADIAIKIRHGSGIREWYKGVV